MGSESPPYQLEVPQETCSHPSPILGSIHPWPPDLWMKSLVPAMLHTASRQRREPSTQPPTLPDPRASRCTWGLALILKSVSCVEYGDCYWSEWGQIPVSNGVNCLGQAAFRRQPLPGRSESFLEASSTALPERGKLRQRGGACPALLSLPLTSGKQLSGLCSLAGIMQLACSPGAHWSFKPSVYSGVWNKVMDLAKVVVQQRMAKLFARPGWWSPHSMSREISVAQFQ